MSSIRWRASDCLISWSTRDIRRCIGIFVLLLRERWPLRSRLFLNLLKDNHCCILICVLLMNFECSTRLTEHYPAPGLNMRVFHIEKKLLLQGSKGLTRDYLPYISSVWGLK